MRTFNTYQQIILLKTVVIHCSNDELIVKISLNFHTFWVWILFIFCNLRGKTKFYLTLIWILYSQLKANFFLFIGYNYFHFQKLPSHTYFSDKIHGLFYIHLQKLFILETSIFVIFQKINLFNMDVFLQKQLTSSHKSLRHAWYHLLKD